LDNLGLVFQDEQSKMVKKIKHCGMYWNIEKRCFWWHWPIYQGQKGKTIKVCEICWNSDERCFRGWPRWPWPIFKV